jgi:hypothetical protein
MGSDGFRPGRSCHTEVYERGNKFKMYRRIHHGTLFEIKAESYRQQAAGNRPNDTILNLPNFSIFCASVASDLSIQKGQILNK